MLETLICEYCERVFDAYPSSNRRYCSLVCYHKNLRGKPTWNKGRGIQQKLTKRLLNYLYWEEKLSISDIAKSFSCSYGTVYYLMEKYNIPRRSRSESLKIKNPGGFKVGYTPWNKGITYESPKNKEYWANPVNRKLQLERIFKGFAKKPTTPERLIIKICEENKFPFKYCGDGSKIIGGKVPDFLHEKGKKKIIEVFGRVFHDPSKAIFDVTWDRQYFGRLAYYSQLGYDCLILWDDELEDEEMVARKIRGFLDA